jgi:hypothetical protein
MTISWGNCDVRVYAAEAWVSLAPRFAADHAVIVDQLEAILADPVAAVRLQAAQNLQVICVAAPERMWVMGERIACSETDARLLTAYLNNSMRRFSHAEPERCEAILTIAKERLEGDLAHDGEGRDYLQESLGGWVAQLYAGQGRKLLRSWLEQWAAEPQRYATLLNAFSSQLRGAFFHRYALEADPKAQQMCDRAQQGFEIILTPALAMSEQSYAVLMSDAGESEKQQASDRYSAAERVIHHAMNQLYFGAGANGEDRETSVGLPDAAAMAHFLSDYGDILALLATAREPSTLHHLVELYAFLIPGDPIAVFEAIHAILLGRGEEEGYHHESLANTAIVKIIKRYIADYRAIFEDEGRRPKLVAILQLFSDVGWTEALRLLYDLPDLLR